MKVIVLFFSICVSSIALSGTDYGVVRFQHGQYGSNSESAGKMFFYLDGGERSSSPACATYQGGERWVVDNNRPAAQMQLSILMAAFVSGKEVVVRGSNACEIHADTETAVDIIFR